MKICWALAVVLLGIGDASAAPVEHLRGGHIAPEGSPWDDTMRAVFGEVKRLVRPGKATLHAGGLLGDEGVHAEQCRSGALQLCGLSDFYMARLVPELGAVAMPFLFRDEAEIEHAFERVLLPRLRSVFREHGLYLYGLSGTGWLDLATKRPVRSAKDLAGLRIRVSDNPVHAALVRALGGSAFATSVHDAESAIQIGSVDGLLHTQVFLQGAGWTTSIQHIWQPRMVFSCSLIVANLRFWEALPPAVRAELDRARTRAERAHWASLRALTPLVREELRKAGVTLTAPDEAEREKLRRELATRRGQLEAALGRRGRALLAELEKALAERR